MAYVAVPALFVWEDLAVEQFGSTLHQESDSKVKWRAGAEERSHVLGLGVVSELNLRLVMCPTGSLLVVTESMLTPTPGCLRAQVSAQPCKFGSRWGFHRRRLVQATALITCNRPTHQPLHGRLMYRCSFTRGAKIQGYRTRTHNPLEHLNKIL